MRSVPLDLLNRVRWLMWGMFAFAFVANGCVAGPGPNAASEDDQPLESLAPDAIHWVTPLASDAVYATEPIDVTVYTQQQDVAVVHFDVDGVEVGACDANDPDADCWDQDNWTWSVSFDGAGSHTFSAWFVDPSGATNRIDRNVTVLAEPDDFADPDPSESTDTSQPDPVPADQQVAEGTGDIVQGIDAPPYHPAYCHKHPHAACASNADPARCQRWAVQGGRVLLPGAHIDGSTSEIDRCMAQYARAIQPYADLNYVSRGSVAAWIAATGRCDPCARWDHGLITGAVCANNARALGHPLTPAACLAEMQNSPDHDFGVQILAEYLKRTGRLHHGDPVLQAAYIHHGAHRQDPAHNRWCVGSGSSSDGFITHFVAEYNAYRTWFNNHPGYTMPTPPSGPLSQPHAVNYGICGQTSQFGAFDTFRAAERAPASEPKICHIYTYWNIVQQEPAGTPTGTATQSGLATWAAQAVGHCDEVLVSFKGDGTGTEAPPSPTAFGAAFARFQALSTGTGIFARWAGHMAYIPWNEPNNRAGAGNGLDRVLSPEQSAQYYLTARTQCDPAAGCRVVAGAFASDGECTPRNFNDDPSHEARCGLDTWRNCADDGDAANTTTRCAHASEHNPGNEPPSYLDRYVNYIAQNAHAMDSALPQGFRPGYFGYHPWTDVNQYIRSRTPCDSYETCITRRMVDGLQGFPSDAEIWMDEVGAGLQVTPAPNPYTSQACGAALLVEMADYSPRITRVYYQLMSGTNGRLYDGGDARPAACVIANRQRTYEGTNCAATGL